MPGLIDIEGNTGLAFTIDTGLQFQSELGTRGLVIDPAPGESGAVLTESGDFVLMEDGVSLILME